MSRWAQVALAIVAVLFVMGLVFGYVVERVTNAFVTQVSATIAAQRGTLPASGISS